MRRALSIVQPSRATFPVLAVLFAVAALVGWGRTLAATPDFSTPGALLDRLFLGTLLAVGTAAAVALWTGAAWLMRAMGAWYVVMLAWMIAQQLSLRGADVLTRSWFWIVFALMAAVAYLPVLYVRARLRAALASLQRVPAGPRPVP